MTRPDSADAAASTRPGAPARALHLVVLWSFAVAWPLLDLLSRTPTFFVARRMDALDVWLLVAGLVLVLPALVALLVTLVARASAGLGWALQLAGVGALCALVPLPALARTPPAVAALLALTIGVAGAWLYARWRPFAALLSAGALAPPVFAALFLLDPAVASLRTRDLPEATPVDSGARAPVVVVVLDELPLYSLLDAERHIDARLFPNFAALAADSTWFRNASAVHVDTADNLIAILTGERPGDAPGIALAAAHPHSLFALLRPTHRLVVRETVTHLLPERAARAAAGGPSRVARSLRLGADLSAVYAHLVAPETLRSTLPALDGRWQGFWQEPGDAGRSASDDSPDERSVAFRRFVAQIDGRQRRSLYFLHSLLPHSPFLYLPSGHRFAGDPRYLGTWSDEPWPTALAFQRHLLQLGWTDRLLGELIARLRAEHLYDPSLLVVVSDHGVSFRPGHSARHLEPETVDDILRVVCLVKRPFQHQGTIDDRNFEHPDLLPTLADALGIELSWSDEGRSGFASAAPPRPLKRIRDRDQREWERDGPLPERIAGLELRTELFGPTPGWDDVFAMGPRPELVGRPLGELAMGDASPAHATLARPAALEHVDLAAVQLPSLIAGRVDAQAAVPEQLAIALNGVVRAVTRVFAREPGSAAFEALIPEAALRPGRNVLRLFEVGGDGTLHEIAIEREGGAA